MAVEDATFKDSTDGAIGICTNLPASARGLLGIPPLSLPITRITPGLKSASVYAMLLGRGASGHRGLEARIETPHSEQARIIASGLCETAIGSLRAEPIEALSAFGLYGLTVPVVATRPVAPAASAVRIIAPMLPGSWSPSATI